MTLWGLAPPGPRGTSASDPLGLAPPGPREDWLDGASGPFAKPMNDIPKVVFSDSLASADWGETTIAAGDLAEAITRLKQGHSDGYLLAHGGYGSPDRWSRPA